MIRSKFFSLFRIADTYRILPYGQAVATRECPLKINSTGAMIWDLLKNDMDFDEITDRIMSMCDLAPSDRPSVYYDVEHFVNLLNAKQMLVPCVERTSKIYNYLPDSRMLAFPDDFRNIPLLKRIAGNKRQLPDFRTHCFSIAGIGLELIMPDSFVPSELADFAQTCATSKKLTAELADCVLTGPTSKKLTVTLADCDSSDELFDAKSTDTPVVCCDNLYVYELNDAYLLTFPGFTHICAAKLTKNGLESTLYYYGHDEYLDCPDTATLDGSIPDEFGPYSFRYEILQSIRTLFAYTALLDRKFFFHSASVLYRDKLILFSATSGTGKSTHADKWARLADAPVINGDLNLLGFDNDGRIMIYGTPWCGTSGIFSVDTYPLGGIFFLQRSKDNHVLELPEATQSLSLLTRLISPRWTFDQLDIAVDFVERLVASKSVFLAELHCSIDDSAFDAAKNFTDTH